jgi:hypothetical protein
MTKKSARRINRSEQRGMPRAKECDRRWAEAIEKHVARVVGPPRFVVHEIVSDFVHVDVHVVPPSKEKPFWFLFTTGMSALPMAVPHGAPCSPFAELSILLPPEWRCDLASWQASTRWGWPVRELISLARYPHWRNTWLSYGHTIAGGEPSPAFDRSTELAAMLVLEATSLPSELSSISIGDAEVDLWTLWPLYREELQHKLSHDLDALLMALDDADIGDIIDPVRPRAICAREAPWGRCNDGPWLQRGVSP